MPAITGVQTGDAPGAGRSARVLDPIARVSEVLFGVIMALTLTGTLSAASAGREDVRELLIGMLGCNFAWGLVDAVMFLLIDNVHRAIRASNLVALVMMFVAGYWLARHGGYHPLGTGLGVVLLGVLLVGIAIALGG